MWMVTKRRPWYDNKLRSIFGGAKVHGIGGYFGSQAPVGTSGILLVYPVS